MSRGMAKGLLWEIRPKHSRRCSYVFGTMHVKSIQAFGKINLLKALIDNVGEYYGEVDLNDSRLLLPETYMVESDDQRLSARLNPRKYSKLRGIIIKAFGVDIAMIDDFRPIIIANNIAQSTLSQEYSSSLDVYLWQYAQDKDRVMKGLESYEEQSTIMDSIPIDFQVQSITSIGKDVAKYRRQIRRMASYYEEQNIRALYMLSKRSLGSLRPLMLYDRNEIMAMRIADGIERSNSTFSAVGAAHLYGNYGVLSYLKRSGYAVRSI